MQAKFSAIPQVYRAPLTETDTKILGLSLSQLVSTCEQRSAIGLLDVLEAYGKRCLLANDSTNCIADIFLDEAAELAAVAALEAAVAALDAVSLASAALAASEAAVEAAELATALADVASEAAELAAVAADVTALLFG